MKTINLNEITHKNLKVLSKSHKKTMVEFVQLAVVYFKKTGIDPELPTTESPQNAIKELSKRVEQIIGVVKTQEQEKMNPLLEQLMMLVRRAEMLLNDAPKESTFKTILGTTEKMIEADQEHHVEQLKTQHKYYKDQVELQQKNYELANAVTVKKMDEVLQGLDKMTAVLKTIKS